MSGKRPRDSDDGDSENKRIRSNNGSPAPAPATSTSSAVPANTADRIAALKAKLAAAKAGTRPDTENPAPVPPPPASNAASPTPVNSRIAEARRRAAEIRARSQNGEAVPANNVSARPAAGQNVGQQEGATDIQTRIAEARARAMALAKDKKAATSSEQEQGQSDLQKRIAEARAKAAAIKQQRAGESATPVPAPAPAPASEPRQEGNVARGGLGIGLHPSLLTKAEPVPTKKSKGPKFSTTKGNQVQENANPYLPTEGDAGADRDGNIIDPSIARPRERKIRPLALNSQGKYIEMMHKMQDAAALDAMNRRMAMETKKKTIEEAGDKSFLVPAPPEVEWWDQALLEPDRKTYDDWEHHNRIEGKDSIVTVYVQHPVLLSAPQDKFMPAAKPMMLTTKEQKKLRRQKRMAIMKEDQAKVRLGLVEPPPPKVKASNMMRVYGEQAVKDPTAVEARVKREIAARAAGHEQANEERKLTKEQRAEKLEKQQADDAAKGIKLAIFKVDNLSSGKHRYQIDINAKQNSLTGLVILHPEQNLVIVEGGSHSIEAYKKLMLNRVKWNENTLPLSNSRSTFTAAAARIVNRDLVEGPTALETWLNPLTEGGELKDLSENHCLLVWEGVERQRSYKKWGSRVCETDGEARDALARNKMENMWALAKGTTA